MAQQPSLSEREKQVADLLLQAKSNKEIALALGISVRTVEFHLTHVFEKLGASSRAEAIVKLPVLYLWKSADGLKKEDMRETAVDFQSAPSQNEGKPFGSLWRYSMRTLYFATIGLVVILLLIFFTLKTVIRPQNEAKPLALSSQNQNDATATITPSLPILTSSPILSPRDLNLAKVHRLAADYDQAVKMELQNGKVDVQRDPQSGKELFLFTGESKEKILLLYDSLNSQLQTLNQQYLAIYIADVQPTPFPTKTTEQETGDTYQELVRQYPEFFDRLLLEGPIVDIYDPSDGIYYKRVIGDTYAKSEIMRQAMEAFRQAPKIAKVNQKVQIAHIQAVLDQPDLQLTFQGIENLANAPSISAAVYADEAGTRYSVAIDQGLLTAIAPAIRPEVPALEVKPIETVRLIAEKFASDHSPRYAVMKSDLLFEQGGKGDIYFFTWRMQKRDWSGTEWAMMPPFLQIGLSADGKIVTYINTLDLYN
jgi:DNA-binding CsgD family transcriptional regulator